MNQGDICLVSFPFTDGTGAKLRPVLVVSTDAFNDGADIIVVPISSQPTPGDPLTIHIDEASAYFAATGLHCALSIKWTKLMTIAKTVVRRRLGAIPEDVMAQVARKIGSLILGG